MTGEEAGRRPRSPVVGRWALLLGLLTIGAVPACGQDEATFVTLGPLGVGGVDGRSGFAVHAALGHRVGRSVIAGRAAAVLVDSEESFLWDGAGDIGILYGRIFGGEDAPLLIAAGPAYVSASVSEEGTPFGLALEAQVLGRVSGKVAAGVSVFGNCNSRSSFWGATLAVRFGG